jgi:hypothetical protein
MPLIDFDKLAKQYESEDDDFGFLENFSRTRKDIKKQIVTKGISGALGSYGNVADIIARINAKRQQ